MKRENLKVQLDLSRRYGLVLEGGGARGSYQIGAWKALRDAGMVIGGIAGTSVGALNGALICMDDFARAREIWENIRCSQVMDVDDRLAERLRDFSLKDLPDALAEGKRIFRSRGIDVSPLRRLIHQVIDEERIRRADQELYGVTYSLTDRRSVTIDFKKLPPGQMEDMLMASSYLTGFRREPLGGKFYTDGCRVNNVPVDVLMDRGYKDIVVIRIYGFGVDTEKNLKIPPDVRLYHICPRQDLGGILEFDGKRARRNMLLGYFDAMALLYGLHGRRYYLYAPQGEDSFFRRLMYDSPWLLCRFQEEPDRPSSESLRFYTEKLFPRAARELGLGPNWNYKDLYLALLEDGARRLGVRRFQIYAVRELREKIQGRKMTRFPESGS